ncbi:hypothetical protein ACH5RR_012263 [Cinchona calisaya]|uniref:WEB family protein n=1 Tax=Cinchona calisaya TaxID=153742 RepID=A0ABD3A7B1_9GENT
MSRSKSSRFGSFDFGEKNHPSVLSRTLSASKFCRGDALVSQIDSKALKSLGRKSVDGHPSKVANSSQNLVHRVSTMQEQMGQAEGELKRTKEQLIAVEEERNRALNELTEAKRLAYEANVKVSEALTSRKVGELMTEIKTLKELLADSQEESKMKDENIESLKLEIQQAKQLVVKLSERDASLVRWKEEFNKAKMAEAHALELLSGSTKRIQELENEVQRGSVSEAKMLDSLASQTKQLEQIKIKLEESKLEIAALNERVVSFEASSKQNKSDLNGPNRIEKKYFISVDAPRSEQKLVVENLSHAQEYQQIASSEFKSSLDEMGLLKNELKLAIEAEEKSKKAMDDLALALKEVATEANQAKEKVSITQLQLEQVKGEAEQLKMMVRSTEERYKMLLDEAKKEAELYRNTADRLRVEAEETLLAWNGKEMGFVSCIKRAEEERAVAQHENFILSESLKAAEHKTRAAREENCKLRDILKQAMNEANAAKAASGIARDENSQLKDCLAEKDEAVYFLTQENERLRISEVAAHENVKELKHLLSISSTELKTGNKDKDGIFRSKSLQVEENEEGNKLERKNLSFNIDELKYTNDSEDSDQTLSHEDPEKAEALKGSIFDSSTDSPRSEPQTPKSVSQHRTESSSALTTDDDETLVPEDLDRLDSSHFDDSDSDRNHRRRRTMFRRVGDLIMKKSFHARETSTE